MYRCKFSTVSCILNTIVNDIFERIDAEASCLDRLCVLMPITQCTKTNQPFSRPTNKNNKEIDTNILVLLLTVVVLYILSSLHLPPSLVSISFIHDTQDDNLKTGGRGRGEMSKDQIIRQQVGLAIYKSFNML